MSKASKEKSRPLAASNTETVTFVPVDLRLNHQLDELREEIAGGFLNHPSEALTLSKEQLRHVRAHLDDRRVLLTDPDERRYLTYVRHGGRFGTSIPRVEGGRLPFTRAINDDYELGIVGDESNRRVAIFFSMRRQPSVRLGYRFVAPAAPGATFAALTFKEDLESGRLREALSTSVEPSSTVRWLRRDR